MTLSCHHRGISRLKSEELLLEHKVDGSFLVRDSESIPNAYTLCILYQGSVRMYRILPDQDGMLYLQSDKSGKVEKYSDLVQLIHGTSQKGESSGLICGLKHPVPVEVDEEEEEKDSEDDDEPPKEYSQQSSVHEFPERATVEMISTYFTNRLTSLDLSNHDSEFISKLSAYASEHVHRDIADVMAGSEEMKEFKKIISESAKELDKHVNIFLSKLDTCQQLFGYAACPMVTKKQDVTDGKSKQVDVSDVMGKCYQCKDLFQSLEKKAMRTLQDLKSKDWTLVDGQLHPARPPRLDITTKKSERKYIPPTSYKARLLKHGKPGVKMTFMVDIQAGKFFAVKSNQESSLDDANSFFHDQVEQVIKSTNNNCRLDLIIQGRKETYLFDDVWTRESFCQMIQELKTFHASSQLVDHLSIFIGTWNMGEDVLPNSLSSWLKSQGQGKQRSPAVGLIPHDLYVIGTQESSVSEKDWVRSIKTSLQDTLAYHAHDMHTVTTVSMWSLRLIVLVRADYKNKISHVQHSTVKTGIANKLGNKGAIGVSFQFDGTGFCFVNCHLTSGHERNAKRNQNVHDIIKGLSLGDKSNILDITNQFHHVFFLGDLNYRLVAMNPPDIIEAIKQERMNNTHNYTNLLELDQLRRSRLKSEVFFGFNEEEITFPPSYRFEKGSVDKYVWQKFKKTGTRINAPSWCDRVIWKSYPETYIRNTSYGMVEEVTTSDHKPVFASFDVGVISQVVSGKQVRAGSTIILFEQIVAEVKTSTKGNFKVEFYSRCLEALAETSVNTDSVTQPQLTNYVRPKWTDVDIPHLIPIFDDREYLEDQHIMLAVKSADGMDSFGECIIALKSMFSTKPEPFECFLTHRGEATGKIKGLMYVRVMCANPAVGKNRRRKSYDLVCLDTDMPQQFMSQMSTPPQVPVLYEEGDRPADTPPVLRKGALMDRQRKGHTDIYDLVQIPFQDMGNRPVVQSKFGRRSAAPDPTSPTSPPPPTTTKGPLKPGGAGGKIGSGAGGGGGGAADSGEDPFYDCPVPVVPARKGKPKLGQSSLAASSVLPAARQTSASTSSITSSSGSGSTSRKPAPPPPSSAAGSRLYDENSNKRQGGINETFRSLPIYFDGPEAKSSSKAPPIVPRKKSVGKEPKKDAGGDQTESYDSLRKPHSINEWLHQLGLPQYIPNFFDNGWDELDYIGSISCTDLVAMAIHNDAHRERIMKSVRSMQSR